MPAKRKPGRPPLPAHLKKPSKVLSVRLKVEQLAHVYKTMEKNEFANSRELFEWLWEEAFGEKL